MLSSIIGSAVGMAGTGLGGVLSLLLRRPSARTLSALMALCGGIMLAVSLVDLLPHAVAYSGILPSALGALSGILAMLLGSYAIAAKERSMRTVGILVGIGIALHNFPEGLAIGSGLSSADSYSIAIMLVILMHDVPEGMAMGLPLNHGGAGKLKSVLLCIASGLPTGLGALLGYALGSVSQAFIGACLAFAGGAMAAITLCELLPEARRQYAGGTFYLALAIGMAAGVLIVAIFE